VPFERLAGWFTRFDDAHPGTTWVASPEMVAGTCPDGTSVRMPVPYQPLADPSVDALVQHVARGWMAGVVLVRKGGFGVARLRSATVLDSKLGRRHVQGRTKAGGWSQHRFARRRDNQARAAFDAAAEHVHRLLSPHAAGLQILGTGGDRQAVNAVLAHPELQAVARVPQRWLGGVADPTRSVLDDAIARLRSVDIEITDPP
jgi:hypothetical protein